jgi:hypothetical protein
MTLAPPTVAELATFSGRPSNTFVDFAVEALAQATLLFYLATSLDEYPSDTNLLKLSKYGILEMADKIYLSQPYKQASASPYQSETIGSYSYSKAVSAVKKGDATGVMWFDLAVNKLKEGTTSIGSSGSIQGMEWDGLESGKDGRYKISGAPDEVITYARTNWEIDTSEAVIHNHPII